LNSKVKKKKNQSNIAQPIKATTIGPPLKNSLTRYELLERPIYKQHEEKREKKHARKPNLADQEIKCPKSG
jgi:hypothetical protein